MPKQILFDARRLPSQGYLFALGRGPNDWLGLSPDAAFGRVRLPNTYTVVRSDRQGGYYDLPGYQMPGEYRVYALPRDSHAPDELIASV